MSSPILLIGVGNDYRGDDGVGLVVVRALRTRRLPNTSCIESKGDGMTLMEAWTTASRVILVDAVSSGAEPGTIYQFDAITQPIPASCSFSSTHAFGVAEALELSRTLDQLPRHMMIYAIEGKNFTAGSGLSPEVKEAVREVVEQIMKEVQKIL